MFEDDPTVTIGRYRIRVHMDRLKTPLQVVSGVVGAILIGYVAGQTSFWLGMDTIELASEFAGPPRVVLQGMVVLGALLLALYCIVGLAYILLYRPVKEIVSVERTEGGER